MVPVWALLDVDELAARQLEDGRRLNQHLAAGKSLVDFEMQTAPRPTDVLVRLSRGSFSVEPAEPQGEFQLALCVIAGNLQGRGWRISNSYREFSSARAYIAVKQFGLQALRPGTHWWLRRYLAPITVGRADQTYQLGFDNFVRTFSKSALHPIAERRMSAKELSDASISAIGSSLTGTECDDYYRGQR